LTKNVVVLIQTRVGDPPMKSLSSSKISKSHRSTN